MELVWSIFCSSDRVKMFRWNFRTKRQAMKRQRQPRKYRFAGSRTERKGTTFYHSALAKDAHPFIALTAEVRHSVYLPPTSRVGKLQPLSRTETSNASLLSALLPSDLDSPWGRLIGHSGPLTKDDTNSTDNPGRCRALSLITRRGSCRRFFFNLKEHS